MVITKIQTSIFYGDPRAKIFIQNNKLDQEDKSKILEEIYILINNLDEFKALGKYRIVIAKVITSEGQELNYHPNVCINEGCSLQDYKDQAIPHMKDFLLDSDFSGYEGEELLGFILDCYGVDRHLSKPKYKIPVSKKGQQIWKAIRVEKRNYHVTSNSKINMISKIKKDPYGSLFFTLDIETISTDNNNIQAVSHVSIYNGNKGIVFNGYKIWDKEIE